MNKIALGFILNCSIYVIFPQEREKQLFLSLQPAPNLIKFKHSSVAEDFQTESSKNNTISQMFPVSIVSACPILPESSAPHSSIANNGGINSICFPLVHIDETKKTKLKQTNEKLNYPYVKTINIKNIYEENDSEKFLYRCALCDKRCKMKSIEMILYHAYINHIPQINSQFNNNECCICFKKYSGRRPVVGITYHLQNQHSVDEKKQFIKKWDLDFSINIYEDQIVEYEESDNESSELNHEITDATNLLLSLAHEPAAMEYQENAISVSTLRSPDNQTTQSSSSTLKNDCAEGKIKITSRNNKLLLLKTINIKNIFDENIEQVARIECTKHPHRGMKRLDAVLMHFYRSHVLNVKKLTKCFLCKTKGFFPKSGFEGGLQSHLKNKHTKKDKINFINEVGIDLLFDIYKKNKD